MNATLVGAVYAIVAAASAFALVPRIASISFLVRCFAVWASSALILFFVDGQGAMLTMAAVMLVLLIPLDPVQRIAFFLVAAPSLPDYIQVYLPFPGINWLILLTYYKVVVIVLLMPLLLRVVTGKGNAGGFSLADTCAVLYIAFSVLLVTASLGFTAGPRFLIDQLIVLGVPYFVLSRLVRSQADVEFCLRAILLVCLILAAVALLSTLKQWDFYRFKEPASVFVIPDVRAGFIRIEATANTHSLGYLLAIGILLLEYLKSSMRLGFIKVWLLRGMLLAGLLTTDSRGALLGLVVAYAVYGVITVRKPGMRWTLLISLAAAVIGMGFWLVTTRDAATLDTYDTIGYRQLLLQVSIRHILEHPIIGDLGFFNDPSFAVLRQGQDIIDITNFYLQVALSFGLVGLALLGGVIVPTMRALMRLAMGASAVSDETRRLSAVIFAAVSGWLLLAATTSDVALTFHLGLMLVALGRGLTRIEAAQAVSAPAPAVAPPLRAIGHLRRLESR